MRRCFFKLFIVTFLVVGCVEHTPTIKEERIIKLSKLLHTLSSNTTEKETLQLSRDIFTKTQQLTKAFEMSSPPQYHNFLVNIGMKEKGLCYHWSDALYLHFMKSNYPSFEFHLLGANIGKYWTEHNSLVIVGKGKPIQSGIIIDPWRNGGELYFSKVKNDHDYLWIHRASRGCSRK
ncbi:hypothetical protein C9926_02760 [Sulfurovum lithotrophicum]|nr:hypothetical protein C9926_02760 [Sulfurovum lithotrophicum]